MAAPHRPPPGIPGEDLWLYDAVVGLGRRGLARSSLSVPDREEVLARYVVAAFEGWRTYCPERGTPGQWLLGVLHNQERAFLRERARSDKGAQIVAESTRTVEEASVSRLETLGSLPEIDREIVWLRVVEGCEFREIAFLVGLSKSQVERRYKAAVKTLRDEGKMLPILALVPMTPPPRASAEELTRAGRRLVEKHGAKRGITDPRELFRDWQDALLPDSEAPKEAQDTEPPSRPKPGGNRPWLRPRRLAGLLAALLAGPLADTGHDRARSDDAAHAAMVAADVAAVSSVAARAAESARDASPVVTSAAAPTSARPGPEPARNVEALAQQLDNALIRQARAAFAGLDFDDAVMALAEHAWRFPHGQHAAAREDLWNQACAHRRAAGLRGATRAAALCAGRP